MSLLCIVAVRLRVIPLWLAVMVAVVGGIGPFAGSIGFIVCERRAAAAGTSAGTRYGLRPAMAVNTTVEVTMPQMGDSVSEGTVLEWHKQEGDQVAEDEVLVEISTDKVDAEVPAPAAGTVVKIHAAEGDTVDRRRRARRDRAQRRRARGCRGRTAAEPRAGGETVDIVMPAMGESVTEGTILEWAKQPGDAVEEDETIVEISTDKVDAEVPGPGVRHDRRDPRAGRRHGHRRPGHRAHDRRRNGAERRAAKAPEPTERAAAAGRARRRRRPRRRQGHPGRRARRRRARRRPRDVQGTGPAGRISKADVLAAENGARAARRARRGHADQGRQRDARALHGRVARGPDRDVVPHAHRHDARRAAASSSRRPASASPSRT